MKPLAHLMVSMVGVIMIVLACFLPMIVHWIHSSNLQCDTLSQKITTFKGTTELCLHYEWPVALDVTCTLTMIALISFGVLSIGLVILSEKN